MEDKIIVPYAPILVESTRSVGYSFEAALADIIDNSIGKGAKEIHVNFRSTGNQFIAVIDDASGMDEEELETAMRYGSKSSLDEREKEDLGRFGLGLKMASLSQCRKLTVVTKKDGFINAARWDLDHIIKKKDWALLKFNDNEINDLYYIDSLKHQESGTIVIWEEFDRIANGSINAQNAFDEKIDLAREHIALVFHRFMDDDNFAKRLKIYFNNVKIEPIDPFLKNNAATQPLIEHTITINDSEIKVKPFILPYASKLTSKDKKLLGDINDLRQNQGFYVYRNRRLIIWGTWFRLIKQYELNKLARVRVDIPNTLDFLWEIDIKKSKASLPDIIKRNLVAIVENTVGRSERVYKYRGRLIKSDDLQHVWNIVDNRGNFQYLVNRELPIYKLLDDLLDDKAREYLDSLIKTIEDAFPFGDVYYRFAKNENNIQTTFLEFDEVYRIALNMIDQIKSVKGDMKTFIETLNNLDFFSRYPEVIKKIKEDFKDD